MKKLLVLLAFLLPGIVFAGGKQEEVTPEEAATLKSSTQNEILAKTVSKPGPPDWKTGQVGGTWITTITNDPKTFNDLTARDEDSRTVVDSLFDYLADYDPYKKEFTPNLASFEIQADEANDSLTVVYTLRDDLYWVTPADGKVQKVTSDDVVYWYDEIEGDPSLQLPGYPGQFIELADGTSARIEIEKLDDRRFAFHYPRIVSNPILSTNMTFGPSYIYKPAKEKNGVEGVLNIFSVDTDVTKIPSIGLLYITEYTPGVRVVLERNPYYWKKDASGTSLPYTEKVIMRIVPDTNTEFLLFKQGEKDAYSVRPEDLDELLSAQNPNYTVYNGGESLASGFITFNQNPNTVKEPKLSWFSKKEFRQAMSSLMNRERVARQVYRGLAAPAYYFFAKANPMFDPDIKLQYTYDPQKAVELLNSIGISRKSDGLMYDSNGNHIEFDMILGAENNIGIDTANIFADELKNVGITLHVRPIDFQKVVESLISTYDWDSVMVALGANYWPSGGSNVWQSNGNFHLWFPLQAQPATEWEARVDLLYNEGRFTLDEAEQVKIYAEYQNIILEQLPVIYIVYPLSFLAIRDKWQNVYFDTLNGLRQEYLYLEQ